MPTYFAQGSPTTDLTHDDLRAALFSVFDKLGPRQKVLAIPPDFTRANSMAGPLTCLAYEYFGPRLTDVMPALGTHAPMADWQIAQNVSRVCRHGSSASTTGGTTWSPSARSRPTRSAA